MQTFITDFNLKKSFRNLDLLRHNKQVIECIQILKALSGASTAWRKHPCVKMWNGYEAFLVKKYLKTAIKELECKRKKIYYSYREWYRYFYWFYYSQSCKKPNWLNEQFVLIHRSKLVEKDMNYYQPIFGCNPGLLYYWKF